MELRERIKYLRKTLLLLTQNEFARKIGLKGSIIGLWESGNRAITERNIILICEKFNVCREWLETGKEPIYEDLNSNIIEACKSLNLDNTEKQFLTAYLRVPAETRQQFKDGLKKILDVYNSMYKDKQ